MILGESTGSMRKRARLLGFSWIIAVFGLFLFSFTQIDLGLTLTRVSFWQPIQRGFQQIGYFQRPLSTFLFISLVILLSTLYFYLVKSVSQKILKRRDFWVLVLATSAILLLAYNAFSYDLFNYLFDAKIVTFYHANPYTHKALDFPDDPFLGFMHWTHRTYPYGPAWLAFSVLLSFLGLQKLLPTLILFKMLAVASYLLAIKLIVDLHKTVSKSDSGLRAAALFAFNPLIVIEALVSAHHDLLMMSLALGSFWLVSQKRFWPALVLFILSAGIKFATFFLLPVFLYLAWQNKRGKPIVWDKVFLASFWLMVAALAALIVRDELKPWYLVYLIIFLPFLVERKVITGAAIGLSLGAVLSYSPYLYHGHWNPPVPLIKNILMVGGAALGLAMGFFKGGFRSRLG